MKNNSMDSSRKNDRPYFIVYDFIYNESAVSAIEYALLASIIATAIISSVNILGLRVLALYELVRLAVEAAV